MSTIYEVRSTPRPPDSKTHYWGAQYNRAEAETLLSELTTGEKQEWADKHHKHWWIEEIDTTGMLEIPSLPPPRERFTTKITSVETRDGTWNTLLVEVLDSNGRVIAEYARNYSNMYQTFEPFRQGPKMFALVSTDYTATSVLDLETGEIIAGETPDAGGFCPIGYYVPDWWDINDGSILPGANHWDSDNEEPKGNFGFVWGCYWGDDSSWKVQYLDLSQVQKGKVLRDDRFGYVKLATNLKLNPKDFIDCCFYKGQCKVTFSILATHDLESGEREKSEFE